jgi:pimeloyl-ACP methyl ester carboxylesterase
MGSELAEAMKQTPMYELYAQLAPRVEDWPVLLAKMGELQRQEYDWSAQVAAMKTPTLLVVGDADMVRLTHIVHFFGLLGGGQRDGGWDRSGVSTSRLAVLPGVTHYEMADLPLLAKTVLPFLQE